MWLGAHLIVSWKKDKSYFLSLHFPCIWKIYIQKVCNGSNFGWLIQQMSIDQKSEWQTFHRRFVSGSIFTSLCTFQWGKVKWKESLIKTFYYHNTNKPRGSCMLKHQTIINFDNSSLHPWCFSKNPKDLQCHFHDWKWAGGSTDKRSCFSSAEKLIRQRLSMSKRASKMFLHEASKRETLFKWTET